MDELLRYLSALALHDYRHPPPQPPESLQDSDAAHQVFWGVLSAWQAENHPQKPQRQRRGLLSRLFGRAVPH